MNKDIKRDVLRSFEENPVIIARHYHEILITTE